MSETEKTGIPITTIFSSEISDKVREIGQTAVWSLSSCKLGFGVQQLCDDSLISFWQSDGPQPHLINVQFHKRTAVRFISIYTDYKADESYTPSKISIRIGNDPHDLHQMELLELDEPSGWVNVELLKNEVPIKTFMIQIAILGNHQSGRDTHLRQIKIFAPKQNLLNEKLPSVEQFMSPMLAQYSCIR